LEELVKESYFVDTKFIMPNLYWYDPKEFLMEIYEDINFRWIWSPYWEEKYIRICNVDMWESGTTCIIEYI
jgi:hypothetical protein